MIQAHGHGKTLKFIICPDELTPTHGNVTLT